MELAQGQQLSMQGRKIRAVSSYCPAECKVHPLNNILVKLKDQVELAHEPGEKFLQILVSDTILKAPILFYSFQV